MAASYEFCGGADQFICVVNHKYILGCLWKEISKLSEIRMSQHVPELHHTPTYNLLKTDTVMSSYQPNLYIINLMWNSPAINRLNKYFVAYK